MDYCAFDLNDVLFAYDLTFSELTELMENIGTLTGEYTGNIVAALDNIYNEEEE